MKSKLLALAVLSFTGFLARAQVGINTNQPKATLDVVGFATDATKLDGIIAPRLTGVQLRAKTYTSSQEGAVVYVTAADTAPAGQTINVTTLGYYFFDGTKWLKLEETDWRITGNADAEITTATETLGSAPASANYLGTKGSDDDLVIVTGGTVHGVLDVNGTLKGGNSNTAAPFASLSWGSNNTFSNTTSSNIALGRSNTVSALAANFPGVAIGYNNNATSGAKLIGNSNTGGNTSAYAFGNGNTITSPAGGFAIGNSNSSNGYAVGTSNTVTVNNYAFGNNNNVSGPTNALSIGFNTANDVSDQSVYGNTAHVFSGAGVIGTAMTNVGINVTPSTTNIADLEVSKGIQLKAASGAAASPSSTCDSSNAGTIIYWVDTGTNTGGFYGCKQTGASAFGWQAL